MVILSGWWLRLGIQIERIRPGHPQQNGRSERMHLTLKREATKPAAAKIKKPAVKIVVGHGTPYVGILDTVRCCTALIAGYTSEYATRSHAISADPLRVGTNDHAAGSMRVKNAS